MRTSRGKPVLIGRSLAGFLVAGSLLAGSNSCNSFERGHAPKRIGPPIVFYETDTSMVEMAGPPDSIATDAREVPRGKATPISRPPIQPPVDVADSTQVEVSPDSLDKPAPSVSIDLSDKERRSLLRVARDDLAVAMARVESAARRSRTPGEGKELETVRGLIEQAQAALDREDLQAAANLAEKARILGEKLPED